MSHPSLLALRAADLLRRPGIRELDTRTQAEMLDRDPEFEIAANAHEGLVKAVVALLQLPQVENPGALPVAQLKKLRKVREQAHEALAAAGETP